MEMSLLIESVTVASRLIDGCTGEEAIAER